MYFEPEYLIFTFGICILLYFTFIVYIKKDKVDGVKYALETIDSNNVVIHTSDCKLINSLENIFILNHFDSYGEAYEHTSILEYHSKDCVHCISNNVD